MLGKYVENTKWLRFSVRMAIWISFTTGWIASAHAQAALNYTWKCLGTGNLDEKLATTIGYQPAEFQDKPFDFEKLSLLFDRVLREAQNIGRPFASISLDSIAQEGNQISAVLDYKPGPLITFDTVQITGDSKIKRLYLNRLLKIMPGTPFSQKQVDRSVEILRNLPSARLSSSPHLSFQNMEATLHLPLNDRKINAVDGIIGLLPNGLRDSKLLVTGRFDLALYNVGGWGRNYSVNWQRLSGHSQSLDIAAMEPMLLGSRLDLGLTYSLLKEDSTFLNRDLRVDLGYRTGPSTYLSFFSRRQSGNLLTVAQGVNPAKLPDIGDFKFNNYGLNMRLGNLDDVVWPRRGWLADVEVGMGNKRLLRNISLPDLVYHNTRLKSFQYYLNLASECHIFVNESFGAFIRGSAGEVENENLLLNDLYRLGGLKSIRGFNENFFFANRYVYVNFEPRYYFDDYSYFLLFLDMGRIWNEVGTRSQDWPRSSGMGARLDTEGGIFNFIVAWGRSNGQAVGLTTPNIHFGYTGKF